MANIPGTPNRDLIYGTNFDDILNQDGDPLSYPGTGGDDYIFGYDGNDRLYGGTGRDNLTGGTGNDRLSGGVDNDALYGESGQDQLYGGADNDYLNGGEGNDVLDGGTGTDGMFGGAGDDTYHVDDINDQTGENSDDALGGDDTVYASATHTLGFGIENLYLTGTAAINATGNGNANSMTGNDANNVLSGLDGHDALNGGNGNDQVLGGNGNDLLSGAAGNDTLNGGAGIDTLLGGTGADTLNGSTGNDLLVGNSGRDLLTGGGGTLAFDMFDFDVVTESRPGGSNRDVITDFNGRGALVGDQIDLRDIDANSLVAGDQAFTYIGSAAFTAAGQLRYSGGVLQGSIDGDTAAEFEIQLVGAPALTVGGAGTDIIL